MAIVPLKKVTLFGSLADRDAVLERLQWLGFLHLLDWENESTESNLDHSQRNDVAAAIRFLARCPVQNPQQRTHYHVGDSCVEVALQVLGNQRRTEALSDQEETLLRQIDLLQPWGDFRPLEVARTGGQRLWFYAAARHELEILQRSTLVWQTISQDDQFVYVVVVQPTPPQMPWPDIELPPRSLRDLQTELEGVREEKETLHWQRVEWTHWLTLLRRDLAQTDDALARRAAAERSLADGPLFALQAWVPQEKLPDLQAFGRQSQVAMVVRDPKPHELPPTLLENPPAVAGAEQAVKFYITPSYHTWDPTWIMYLSFTVFFAMIVADAAYGFVFGLGLWLFWGRLSRSETNRRVRNLLLAMVLATIAYGVATGSYFGVTPPGLARLQIRVEGKPLLTHKDAMMMLSLGIGVLHLVLANLITAWQQRRRAQALSAGGWAIGLIGGYVWGLFSQPTNKASIWLAEVWGRDPQLFQPAFKMAGQAGLFAGLALVLLFSSARPLLSRRPADWGGRLLDGLLGLTNVTKAFGDVLSYLRLFALGFASAQLAVTFNEMAAGMWAVPGVGMLLALLVLLLGHTVNMVLGVMGGVVHGLRLNCIEFFNWSLTEEGHPFQAFSKKAF